MVYHVLCIMYYCMFTIAELRTTRKRETPHHARKWMISKELESQSCDLGKGSEELLADNSDDGSSDLSCSTED